MVWYKPSMKSLIDCLMDTTNKPYENALREVSSIGWRKRNETAPYMPVVDFQDIVKPYPYGRPSKMEVANFMTKVGYSFENALIELDRIKPTRIDPIMDKSSYLGLWRPPFKLR